MIVRFYKEFSINNRNAATQEDIRHLKELQIIIELEDNGDWLDNFTNNYTA